MQTEGTKSSHRYALIASDCPFPEQDALFRSVDDMRVNFYLFREWALDLFGRWAPLHSAPLGNDANVCSRVFLRAYCLEEPRTDVPGANSVTHFWLAAWWRRLYGPLVSFEQFFRYLLGLIDCNTRSLLSVGARFGPGQIGFLDPADYCWVLGMGLSTCDAQYARCICDVEEAYLMVPDFPVLLAVHWAADSGLSVVVLIGAVASSFQLRLLLGFGWLSFDLHLFSVPSVSGC